MPSPPRQWLLVGMLESSTAATIALKIWRWTWRCGALLTLLFTWWDHFALLCPGAMWGAGGLQLERQTCWTWMFPHENHFFLWMWILCISLAAHIYTSNICLLYELYSCFWLVTRIRSMHSENIEAWKNTLHATAYVLQVDSSFIYSRMPFQSQVRHPQSLFDLPPLPLSNFFMLSVEQRVNSEAAHVVLIGKHVLLPGLLEVLFMSKHSAKKMLLACKHSFLRNNVDKQRRWVVESWKKIPLAV